MVSLRNFSRRMQWNILSLKVVKNLSNYIWYENVKKYYILWGSGSV